MNLRPRRYSKYAGLRISHHKKGPIYNVGNLKWQYNTRTIMTVNEKVCLKASKQNLFCFVFFFCQGNWIDMYAVAVSQESHFLRPPCCFPVHPGQFPKGIYPKKEELAPMSTLPKSFFSFQKGRTLKTKRKCSPAPF